MSGVIFRTAYNPKVPETYLATILITGTETPTTQSHKEECDINTIVKRFGITGMVPQNLAPLTFGDFTNVGDFRSAMDALNDAKDRFMQLESRVRDRFGNSPQAFLEFCEERDKDGNRSNIAKMREWGLAVDPPKVPEVVPVKVEVINPPTAAKPG